MLQKDQVCMFETLKDAIKVKWFCAPHREKLLFLWRDRSLTPRQSRPSLFMPFPTLSNRRRRRRKRRRGRRRLWEVFNCRTIWQLLQIGGSQSKVDVIKIPRKRTRIEIQEPIHIIFSQDGFWWRMVFWILMPAFFWVGWLVEWLVVWVFS